MDSLFSILTPLLWESVELMQYLTEQKLLLHQQCDNMLICKFELEIYKIICVAYSGLKESENKWTPNRAISV